MRTINQPRHEPSERDAVYVVFDLELTGLNPDTSRVIDSGIVLCDRFGEIISTYETLVNPGVDTGPVHIHQITNEMVANVPTFSDVAQDLRGYFDGKTVVGLNNKLDFAILKREFSALYIYISFNPGSNFDLSNLLRDAKFTDMYENEIIKAINSQETEH